MRHRAIKDLSQLSDSDLFIQVAKGLEHIVNNAQGFYADSELLATQLRGPSSRVLRTIAEEEAAKYLILIDAVRCHKQSKDFTRQLGRFYCHLSRGIYAYIAIGQSPTFGELRSWVEEECKSLFLDGPEGYDYIYRNRILDRRESRMYVDYEKLEDGEHIWSTPRHHNEGMALSLQGVIPPVLATVLSLNKVGFASPQGLKLLSDIWQPISMADTITRSELREFIQNTCEEADRQALPGSRDIESTSRLTQYWQFPMYSLDMKLIDVSVDELQNQRTAMWLSEFDNDYF